MVAPVVAAPIAPVDGFGTETFVSVEKLGRRYSVLHEKSCENQQLRRARITRQAQPLHFSQRTRPLRRRELLSFILHSRSNAQQPHSQALSRSDQEAFRRNRRRQLRTGSFDKEDNINGCQVNHGGGCASVQGCRRFKIIAIVPPIERRERLPR